MWNDDDRLSKVTRTCFSHYKELLLTVKPAKTHSSSLHFYCFLPLFHFSFYLRCLGVRLQLQDKPAAGLEILSRFENNSPTHPGCEMFKSVG